MRVLIVTNLFPNPLQPQRATFNRQQFAALAAEHDVRVIAPVAWTDELVGWWRGMPGIPGGRRAEVDGLVAEYPRYWFTPKVLRGWYGHFFRWSVRRAFGRAVAEFRPDVVLASWAYPDGLAAVELGHGAGLPVVIKVHGSDVLLADGVRRRRVAEASRQADGVVTVSQDLARRVIDLGVNPQLVRVIYNGVDPNLFHPGDRLEARGRLGWRRDVPQILFVGNLVPVKGLDVLIDALVRLARQGCAFVCHLVGQGPLRRELERRVAATGLNDRVKFAGPVAHDRLPDWFRAADLLVLPSRSEGVPNVLLEASACGLRYVASNVGGIPEIAALGDAQLVPPGDAEALSAAIAEWLSVPVAGLALRRGAVRSFEDAARELARLLADVRERYPSRNCHGMHRMASRGALRSQSPDVESDRSAHVLGQRSSACG